MDQFPSGEVDQFPSGGSTDLVAACRAARLHDNPTLREIVEDYERYCAESELLSGHEERVMAVAVGTTHAENVELRLYYAPVERGFQKHRYLALYADKTVHEIGEIENVVVANRTGDKLTVVSSDARVTDDQKKRIQRAISLARGHDYSIEQGHRFFLVSSFAPTRFRKISPGGLMGKRYFSLREVLGLDHSNPLPPLPAIAESLRSATWE